MIVNINEAKKLISIYQDIIKNNTLFHASKEKYIESNGWVTNKHRVPVPYKLLTQETKFKTTDCILCAAVGRNTDGGKDCDTCVWSITSKNKNGLLYCNNNNAFNMFKEMDFSKFNKLLSRRITLLKKAIKLSEEQNKKELQ